MARKGPEPFDPYELGTRRSDPTLGALEPLPPNPRRIAPRTLLLYFFGAVVLFAVISRGHHRGVPTITASCTKAGFALASATVPVTVPANGLLGWSAVGPAGDAIVVGADTPTLPTSVATGRLAGPSKLLGCAASGRFGVPLTAGSHTISVFDVLPDGSSVLLGTRRITVTG